MPLILRYLRALVFVLGLGIWPGAAMAVEEPAYKLITKDGNFEVRAYPAVVAAEVHVTGSREAAVNKGFRLLADYIFGNNQGRTKVAMTAPVTQTPSAGTKIAMTAPVTQMGKDGDWIVRFIMPAAFTIDTLPKPNNAEVHLVPVPPARYAVIRFSGLTGEKDVASKIKDLNTWIQMKRLAATGAPTLARYDPPWTPWFMRRNELLVALSDEPH